MWVQEWENYAAYQILGSRKFSYSTMEQYRHNVKPHMEVFIFHRGKNDFHTFSLLMLQTKMIGFVLKYGSDPLPYFKTGRRLKKEKLQFKRCKI